jgi:hypothetical protein
VVFRRRGRDVRGRAGMMLVAILALMTRFLTRMGRKMRCAAISAKWGRSQSCPLAFWSQTAISGQGPAKPGRWQLDRPGDVQRQSQNWTYAKRRPVGLECSSSQSASSVPLSRWRRDGTTRLRRYRYLMWRSLIASGGGVVVAPLGYRLRPEWDTAGDIWRECHSRRGRDFERSLTTLWLNRHNLNAT